jgi:hypothetical protein
MPTIHQEDGFDFIIYPNDHPPAHIHVCKAQGEAIVILGDSEEGPYVRDNFNMKKKNEKKALRITERKNEDFWEGWEKYHGN